MAIHISFEQLWVGGGNTLTIQILRATILSIFFNRDRQTATTKVHTTKSGKFVTLVEC
ncbi:Uncharacterised protein [Vibrio cholerae]|nr:Uncharacterised protein [Vibrio cholerae]